MYVKCVMCNVDFEYDKRMPNKKYCSRKCASSDKVFIKNRSEKIKATYQNRKLTSNKCVWCDSYLDNRHKKFCSKKCKSEEANSRLKSITRNNTKIKGKILKTEIIKLKGGGCKLCGYNKNIKALSFHHLYDKKFELSVTNLVKFNKQTIIDEINKCIILCMNCHQEVHDSNTICENDKVILVSDIEDSLFVKAKNKNITITKIRNKVIVTQ